MASEQPHLPERGLAPLRRLGQHAEALGGGEGDPGQEGPLDPGRGGPGPGGGADARARPLAGGAEGGGARGKARLRPRRGAVPRPGGRGLDRGGGGGDRAGAGADRAPADDAGDADRARAHAQPRRPRGDALLRPHPRGGPAACRLPAAGPRLRAVAAQDRRRRGAPVPPLRPRAADPRRRPGAGDGGGDAGPRRRPAAAGDAAVRVHAQPLPALLHRAGRRRPHGERVGPRHHGSAGSW